MRSLPAALLLATATAFALSGCAADSDVDVEVDDDYFKPTEKTIEAGTEVHFEVESSAQHPHTVTIHKAGDPVTTLLLNETVEAGDDVHFDFEAKGTYHVWCMFHGGMTSGMHMIMTVE
jgi:plastocyanin